MGWKGVSSDAGAGGDQEGPAPSPSDAWSGQVHLWLPKTQPALATWRCQQTLPGPSQAGRWTEGSVWHLRCSQTSPGCLCWCGGVPTHQGGACTLFDERRGPSFPPPSSLWQHSGTQHRPCIHNSGRMSRSSLPTPPPNPRTLHPCPNVLGLQHARPLLLPRRCPFRLCLGVSAHLPLATNKTPTTSWSRHVNSFMCVSISCSWQPGRSA